MSDREQLASRIELDWYRPLTPHDSRRWRAWEELKKVMVTQVAPLLEEAE